MTALNQTANPSAAPTADAAIHWLATQTRTETFRLLAVVLLHVLLGVALAKSSLLGTAHAAVVFACGFWLLLFAPSLPRLACVGAYVTGAEVLWRMTQANLPWETGKYGISTLFVLALFRTGQLKGPVLIFLFFLLLLPSLVLPLAYLDPVDLRKQVSFNLSGPLALTISVWFFSQVKLTPKQLHLLFLSLAGPIISIGTVSFRGIATAKDLTFSEKSNFAASGGFGPNQVSSLLGLSVLVFFLWAFEETTPLRLRLILCVLMLALGIQSALTFSRGGLYSALIGSFLGALFLVRNFQTKLQMTGGVLLLLLLFNFLVLPRLDNFTGGSLSKRFGSARLTGRDRLASEDLQVFFENPLFGVGPGQTNNYRAQTGNHNRVAAHTEFSRLLAEHGLFGLGALLLLLLSALQHYRQAKPVRGKALTCAAVAWSFVYMLGAAMRTVAPSFVFGLSAITILPAKEE